MKIRPLYQVGDNIRVTPTIACLKKRFAELAKTRRFVKTEGRTTRDRVPGTRRWNQAWRYDK